MTPVYMSPNIEQIEMIKAALWKQGIATSMINKKPVEGSVTTVPKTMHELWLKNQSDRARAQKIITQQEFQMLRRDMKNTAVKDHRATQPVNIRELHGLTSDAITPKESKQPQNKKDYAVPRNLIHVFKRLGGMLGMSEPEMDLDNFYKINKPWDGDSLMKSVENLKKKTKTADNVD